MALDKLLYLRGVGLEYTNYHGEHVVISNDDRQEILGCMLEHKQVTPELIDAQNHEIDARPWLRPLGEFQWCHIDDLTIEVRVLASLKGILHFSITTESGESFVLDVDLCRSLSANLKCIGDYFIDGHCYLNYQISITSQKHTLLAAGIGLGYHKLELTYSSSEILLGFEDVETEGYYHYGQKQYSGTLMVVPRQAYQGCLRSEKEPSLPTKVWGVSAQLYSVRTYRQWGIGDFADLRLLIQRFCVLGASFIQLNPLHALNHHSLDDVSPYSPSDRRRLNALYIDIEGLPEFQYEADEFSLPHWHVERARLNGLDWIEYDKVYLHKFAALALMYEAFCVNDLYQQSLRGKQFQQFVGQQGASLLSYALFEAKVGLVRLSEHADIASMGARAGQAYSRVVAKQEFYLYLQFVAQEQLTQCQRLAEHEGMRIGIVRDLAVGAKADGHEVQEGQALFCSSASIGAPPDDFSAQGQDWGLPPLDPIALVNNKYQHFICLVRSNLQNSGALRIDHIMGLYRLWWWSQASCDDHQTKAGAYVHYPVDTLMAILCLESHRAKSILIGEDLGLVPESIKHQLKQCAIVSNELFYFCRHKDSFFSPQDYKQHSLLMLANHDVPPLSAWWQQKDIEQATQLNLFRHDEERDRALRLREQHKLELIKQLAENGQLALEHNDKSTGAPLSHSEWISIMQHVSLEELLSAWIKTMGKANSSLLCIQLCDLGLDTKAVNIPGTWKEYPNWRRRMPLSVDEILEQDWVRNALNDVNKVRRNGLEH